MAYGDKPFGLRDIKITNLAGTTQLDLPAAQTLRFVERLVTNELRGDDVICSASSYPDAIEWELSHGGVSLEIWALMTGRSTTEAGTTPNRTNTMTAAAGAQLPYFKIYGKALGDNSDDIHIKLNKCKLTSGLEGTFQDGEFYITSASGMGLQDDGGTLFEIVQNETPATLPSS